MNKNFRVRVEYRGDVTVTVEAADEKEAERKAITEADDTIGVNLSVYDVHIKEV